MINFNQVSKIINTPDPSTPKGLQDKALLSLLFGSGLRRSEAINLKIGDVRYTMNGTCYLYLRSTKSGKDYKQALPKWAQTEIELLITQRKKQNASDNNYLFISYRGQGGKTPTHYPLSESGVYKLFKKYCKLAGITNPISPHSARATAITKLLDDGLSHRDVKEFSRHSSIQMVEIYDKRRISVDKSPAKQLKF